MIKITTFGYRSRRIPSEASYLLDCRKLENPHFIPSLRNLDGRHPDVQAFVKADLGFNPIYVSAREHAVQRDGAHVAFGCYGGRHRSVALAELLARDLRGLGYPVEVHHQELAEV